MTPQETAQQQSTALVAFANGQVDLPTLDKALTFAGVLVRSGLCPSFKTPESLVLAWTLARSMDVPLAAVNNYFYVVNGRAAVFGKMTPAIAMRTGELAEYREAIEGAGDDMTAVCAGARKFAKTDVSIPHAARFSVADAKRAGLWGKAGPWAQYPKDMLMNKARARFFGFLFADALCGLPVKEDVQDVDQGDGMENARPARPGIVDVLEVHPSLPPPAQEAPSRPFEQQTTPPNPPPPDAPPAQPKAPNADPATDSDVDSIFPSPAQTVGLSAMDRAFTQEPMLPMPESAPEPGLEGLPPDADWVGHPKVGDIMQALMKAGFDLAARGRVEDYVKQQAGVALLSDLPGERLDKLLAAIKAGKFDKYRTPAAPAGAKEQ